MTYKQITKRLAKIVNAEVCFRPSLKYVQDQGEFSFTNSATTRVWVFQDKSTEINIRDLTPEQAETILYVVRNFWS